MGTDPDMDDVEIEYYESLKWQADLDGTLLMAATPDVERCWFCLNPATLDSEIMRHDELETVRVCGLHS